MVVPELGFLQPGPVPQQPLGSRSVVRELVWLEPEPEWPLTQRQPKRNEGTGTGSAGAGDLGRVDSLCHRPAPLAVPGYPQEYAR